MKDDADNSVYNFSYSEGVIDGQVTEGSILPADKITDIQMFQMPLPNTKNFTLIFGLDVLTYDNLDHPLDGDVKFTFKPDVIRTMRH